jgi:hypothetical protein
MMSSVSQAANGCAARLCAERLNKQMLGYLGFRVYCFYGLGLGDLGLGKKGLRKRV